jgi:TatD DNase family protein
MQLTDTHTHLYGEEYDEDRAETVDRAEAAGVTRLVAIGAGLDSSEAAVALAESRPNVIAAVGVHPHEARDFDEPQWEKIRSLALRPDVRAIGEIGLDYHYDFSPREAQRACFQAQLSLAAHAGLPVVIHMREAEEEVYEVLKAAVAAHPPSEDGGTGAVAGIIMHCFLGGPEWAEKWLGLGCLLGIGGAVTFKKSNELREAIRTAPLDRLVLETDCPYMTPHPYRGKRNEPSYIPLVAQAVADAKGLTVEEVAAATTANALAFFGMWPESRAGD